MLCPNTQAVTNGYLAGLAPKTCRNLDLGMGKCISKEGVQPHFFRNPRIMDMWMKKMEKKYVKTRGTTLVSAHFFP